MIDHAFLGIDFGTSGARALVIDDAGEVLAQGRYDFHGEQSGSLWRTALFELIAQIPFTLRNVLRAISVNGTSATVLLCDATGEPLSAPLLYNDARARTEAEALAQMAPRDHVAATPTSGLAKLMWLSSQPGFDAAACCMHQADWLGFLLHGKLGVSDYHNALKSGGDPETLDYPAWIKTLPFAALLPRIVEPGSVIGTLSSRTAHHFSLPRDCVVRAGTTDSIAAFLAAGSGKPGEAVSSLGSTLVLKLLSERRVDSARHGIYSHRFGKLWLTGGASNSGGAVLRSFFNDAELQNLSLRIDPQQPSGLDYYPLLQPGERFPVSDPVYPPRLAPRPVDDARFLHGLLEGIARIEAQGYRLLQELGATPLISVRSAGGGARNPAFSAIRARLLGVPLQIACHEEAAYGSALLARDGSLMFRARE
ncbi:MAG: FGGY-family carbohydrate kinase [Sulfurimicrobium sp.]|nr:FGGY-family carbohydrate kinase [Sulfurimicrobium sp.]MDZ7656269.1 FGGY-family carbohydrate kinase [Sulfurimicrobium sp.]